ncbi:MAG: peptidylprolyl isomerase [Treponema sp.]|jgi:peptidylprolyl isomerase|nr:peptidylprolyl isomerase [Treponema sp.]
MNTATKYSFAAGMSVILFFSIAVDASAQTRDAALGDGLFARLTTTRGDIIIRLEYQKAPLTVCNFVALAEGKMNTTGNRPFYNGLTFHRVEPNFVIQGGDPLGNGRGGPGYEFPNEIDPTLRHDGPGVVAMANAGPDTNGSQFYITLRAASHLDGGYSIFGRVVEGQNVVNAIRVGDRIERITIIRNGQAAQAFRADQAAFDALLRNVNAAKAAELQARRNADIAEIQRSYPNAVTTPLGLRYIIQRQGSGAKPTAGRTVRINYTGMLLSGRVFDNSDLRGPLEFQVGAGRVIPGMDIAVMDMTVGEKRIVIIPPELAYGSVEMGNGLIPANSFLVFEIELLSIR